MIRAFLLGKALPYIMLALAIAWPSSLVWSYLKGRSDCAAHEKVRALTLQLTEANRRNAAKDNVARELREETERRAAELETLTDQVEDYADELASRDDAVCRLDDRDAQRLRSIR